MTSAHSYLFYVSLREGGAAGQERTGAASTRAARGGGRACASDGHRSTHASGCTLQPYNPTTLNTKSYNSKNRNPKP